MAYVNCDLFRERAVCTPTEDTGCTTAIEPCKLKRSWKNLILVLLGFVVLRTFVKTKK